jgi:hypothetical protein
MAPAAPPMGEFGAPIPGLAAPPQPPSPGALQDVADIIEITNRLKNIVQRHPQATPAVTEIQNQLQQLQMVMTQVAPPTEVAAPPV